MQSEHHLQVPRDRHSDYQWVGGAYRPLAGEGHTVRPLVGSRVLTALRRRAASL